MTRTTKTILNRQFFKIMKAKDYVKARQFLIDKWHTYVTNDEAVSKENRKCRKDREKDWDDWLGLARRRFVIHHIRVQPEFFANLKEAPVCEQTPLVPKLNASLFTDAVELKPVLLDMWLGQDEGKLDMGKRCLLCFVQHSGEAFRFKFVMNQQYFKSK